MSQEVEHSLPHSTSRPALEGKFAQRGAEAQLCLKRPLLATGKGLGRRWLLSVRGRERLPGAEPRVTGVCAQSCPTLRPHRLPPPRLLRSWNFPCKNTGASCHFLLQGIFPTQGPNQCLLRLLHWQAGSLALHHLGSHCYLLTLKISGLEYPFPPPPFFLLLA